LFRGSAKRRARRAYWLASKRTLITHFY
jgi:hypothetical protein